MLCVLPLLLAGGEAEPTEELQARLEDFVELVESPVFMRVRWQLLQAGWHPGLLRAFLNLVELCPEE